MICSPWKPNSSTSVASNATREISSFAVPHNKSPPRPKPAGHDRLAPDLMEGDVWVCYVRRGRGNDDRRLTRPSSVGQASALHVAHRTADHGGEAFDAEMIEQHELGAHHVGAMVMTGKRIALRCAGRGIDARRARGAHAAGEHIGANNEVTLGVDRLAGADRAVHQAGFGCDRMDRGC